MDDKGRAQVRVAFDRIAAALESAPEDTRWLLAGAAVTAASRKLDAIASELVEQAFVEDGELDVEYKAPAVIKEALAQLERWAGLAFMLAEYREQYEPAIEPAGGELVVPR